MLVGLLLVVAIVAGILTARSEGESIPKTRMEWARTIAYWVFTIAVAFEMVAGGIWDLLRIEFVRVSLTRLGYPLYLLYILGPPKVLCAILLLVPRFPRIKEWAYAGAVINYMGAAASLLLTVRATAEWVAPLVFAALTMGSWALRPARRKLVASGPATRVRAIAWLVPVLIAGAMVAVAFVSLPTSTPH
jgi:hypothetical protein